jgi:hypothetical protein
MGRCARGLLPLLAAAALGGGLVACGGGSAPSAATPVTSAHVTTAAPSASAPTTAATTTTAPATTATSPAHTTAPAPSATSTGSSAESAHGPAAGFRVQGGDNSVPDYGHEAGASERQRAEAALAAFLRARAQSDWPRVCAALASATRIQLDALASGSRTGTGGATTGSTRICERILKALSARPRASDADTLVSGVASLRIDGANAFALWHGPGHTKFVMPMRNEGGVWKVTHIEPLPYPLGSAAAAPAK